MTRLRVKQVLERLREMRGLPTATTVDNGPNLMRPMGSRLILRCAERSEARFIS